MPSVLLRPQLLGWKNKLKLRAQDPQVIFRDLILILVLSIIAGGAFVLTRDLLLEVINNPELSNAIAGKILSSCLLFFFLLLLFSSFIGALGHMYTSNDLPILLALPISYTRLFNSRFIETTIKSSWMFFLFSIPMFLAFKSAFNLSWVFVLESFLLMIPFVVTPCAISAILVSVMVNLMPAERLKEFLAGLFFFITVGFFYLGKNLPANLSQADFSKDTLSMLGTMKDPHPFWFPSKWVAEFISRHFLDIPSSTGGLLILIISVSVVSYTIGLCLFDKFFFRGWAMANQGGNAKKLESARLSRLLRYLLPVRPQLRAFMYKEARLLLRDPTQSLQLLMLLLLTSIYLYNFRSLRMVSNLSIEVLEWWRALLAAANIILGGCVIAAISTRFVYPSVSLEGKTYFLIRVAPLAIKSFLLRKFLIWFAPMALVGCVLTISGALAIQVSPD